MVTSYTDPWKFSPSKVSCYIALRDFAAEKDSCVEWYSNYYYAHIQDWSNQSPLMLHRQHHPDGNKEMQAQMALFFHLPNKWEIPYLI